jgi:predicted small lipoprotein YifL
LVFLRSTVRIFVFGAAVSLALGLAACGRKGPLDLPPGDTPTPQANANLTQSSPSFGPAGLLPGSQQQPQQQPAGPPNAYDSQGRPIYLPPSKNKSFILDPILN